MVVFVISGGCGCGPADSGNGAFVVAKPRSTPERSGTAALVMSVARLRNSDRITRRRSHSTPFGPNLKQIYGTRLNRSNGVTDVVGIYVLGGRSRQAHT